MDSITRQAIEKLLNSISTEEVDVFVSPLNQIVLATGVELLNAAYLGISLESYDPIVRNLLWDVREAVTE